MAGKFDKNFTEKGYLMNYEKPKDLALIKNSVFQFKVELLEVSPTVWRRIQVPANYNFWDLHVAIQDAMGWTDRHLHHFEIRGKGKHKERQIGIPDFYRMNELEDIYPGWEIPVYEYFNDLGVTAKYLYDYGDMWLHQVKLEGYIHREKGIRYPICIDGARACPPEDCGGVPGYYNVLEVLSNPQNVNYKDVNMWVGENWDPETFNKNDVEFHDPYSRWVYAFLEG